MAEMYDWSKGHPFFRTEVKKSQYEVFIANEGETRNELMERVRAWIKGKSKIKIKGGAWGYEPIKNVEERKVSPYKLKYTVTYTDA